MATTWPAEASPFNCGAAAPISPPPYASPRPCAPPLHTTANDSHSGSFPSSSTGKRLRTDFSPPHGTGRAHFERRGTSSPSRLTGSESRGNSSPLSSGQTSPCVKLALKPPTPLSLVGGFHRLAMDNPPGGTSMHINAEPFALLTRKRQRTGLVAPPAVSTEMSDQQPTFKLRAVAPPNQGWAASPVLRCSPPTPPLEASPISRSCSSMPAFEASPVFHPSPPTISATIYPALTNCHAPTGLWAAGSGGASQLPPSLAHNVSQDATWPSCIVVPNFKAPAGLWAAGEGAIAAPLPDGGALGGCLKYRSVLGKEGGNGPMLVAGKEGHELEGHRCEGYRRPHERWPAANRAGQWEANDERGRQRNQPPGHVTVLGSGDGSAAGRVVSGDRGDAIAGSLWWPSDGKTRATRATQATSVYDVACAWAAPALEAATAYSVTCARESDAEHTACSAARGVLPPSLACNLPPLPPGAECSPRTAVPSCNVPAGLWAAENSLASQQASTHAFGVSSEATWPSRVAVAVPSCNMPAGPWASTVSHLQFGLAGSASPAATLSASMAVPSYNAPVGLWAAGDTAHLSAHLARSQSPGASLSARIAVPSARSHSTPAFKSRPDLRIDVSCRRSSLSIPSGLRSALRTTHRQPNTDSDDEIDDRMWRSPEELEIDPGSADAAGGDSEMAPRVRSPTDEERLSPVSKLLLFPRRRR